MHIVDGDQEKAAFLTKWGLFEPTIMFFRLTNSPATFQTMMNHIFCDLIRKGKVLVYMDDIIIFTNNLEEHHKLTREVLEILRQNNLYLKPEKCEFEKMTVEYLGVIISQNSMAVDPVKAAAVLEWPTPKKLKDVQEFVGFLNFYRRFIPNFSHIAQPLYNLTKKGENFKWTTACEATFLELKNLIGNTPILHLANNDGHFHVEVDACL